MIKYISFDLQGTLSNSKFSDNFWINILPKLYASKYNLDIEDAKLELKIYFKKIGKYDIRYYDDKYWEKKLHISTIEVLNNSDIKPILNQKLFDFIDYINVPVIIISTTTKKFIEYELGSTINKFYNVYSCVDDFNTGGKTKEVFLKVAKSLKVSSDEILHIGDDVEMDIQNGNVAKINTILFNNNEEDIIEKIKICLGR